MPPKFYEELCRFFTVDDNHSPSRLLTFDYDTGLPIQRPIADLYLQALNSVRYCPKTTQQPLSLKPLFRLELNPFFYPNIDSITSQPLPDRGYPWTIIPHPTITQLSLECVYTRDQVTNEVYVQHYQVTPQPIDTYQLKPTKRNNNSKGSTKYACTKDTSAIIKC